MSTKKNIGREMKNKEKWNQLNNAVTYACKQDQTIWNIFGYFWGTNALLLIALFSDGKFPEEDWIGLIISVLGGSLSLMWGRIQKRSIQHLRRYEEIEFNMEESLNLKPSECLNGKRNTQDLERFVGKVGVGRSIIIGNCYVISVLWFISLMLFLYKIICSHT